MLEVPPILFVKLVVCDGAGRLLLQRRRKDDRYLGFWELPGGRVRAGETLLAAARRELLEETGLELERLLAQSGREERDRFGGVAREVNPLVTVETSVDDAPGSEPRSAEPQSATTNPPVLRDAVPPHTGPPHAVSPHAVPRHGVPRPGSGSEAIAHRGGTLVLGHYFACRARGSVAETLEADAHQWVTPERLRRDFLERPEIDLSTLDRLALRRSFDTIRRCLADSV
ncbi:MAG: NUDIX domain-containing protein [Candidatus Eisenbacteria bacterium]|nr:NUDIX domain-containing protein [Candidatus Eisenbacteria bacterium]